MAKSAFTLIVLCLLFLNACASKNAFKPTVPNHLFLCDGARQITISIADMSDEALIQYEGRNIALRRIDASQGQAFTNNIYTLYYDDGLAVLEREGVPILTSCSSA